jgi:hypothetical protein
MEDREASPTSLAIACLGVGGAALAILILSGDEGGTALVATFAAAIALPFFGLTGAAGLLLCHRDQATALLGALTMTLSVLGAVAVVAIAFGDELFFGDDWRPAAYLLIACLAAAHCSALLADAREDDSGGVQLGRAGMVVSIALLATLALIEISSSGKDIGVRPLGLIAVLYLFSASAFGLLRFSGGGARA